MTRMQNRRYDMTAYRSSRFDKFIGTLFAAVMVCAVLMLAYDVVVGLVHLPHDLAVCQRMMGGGK